MMKDILKKAISKYLKRFEVKNIPSKTKVVYLTFDDGPEQGITEFVLDELQKHKFKATFFCRGDNAEKNPELMSLIREQGHGIANHTYNHLHAYEVPAKKYLADVEQADAILKTHLFRPPKGDLTLRTFLGLHKKYKIVYWALNSEDSDKDRFNYEHAYKNLTSNTQTGDVILFHFCHRHEKETRQLLPNYLAWLSKNGFCSKLIE